MKKIWDTDGRSIFIKGGQVIARTVKKDPEIAKFIVSSINNYVKLLRVTELWHGKYKVKTHPGCDICPIIQSAQMLLKEDSL